MAEQIVPPRPARKRRRFLQAALWVAGVFVVLLVAIYFTVSSPAFLKKVVLPRVSKSLNADVTVSNASVHPFSRVELRGLKVQPRGREPLITAREVRAHYSLVNILRGKIDVAELALVSPTINIVENPDGTSNLDALEKEPRTEHAKELEMKSDKAKQLDIRKISLSDAAVRQIKIYANGQRDLTELSDANLTLSDLRNGQSGTLDLSANVKTDSHPPDATHSTLGGRLAGQFSFSLTAGGKPASLQGQIKLAVTKATGRWAEFAALDATIHSDVTPNEVKDISLTFQKAGSQLGQIRASGPFDASKREGRLDVEVRSIDRQVLNLVGAASGIDFGTMQINSSNRIEIARAGKVIHAAGKLYAAKVRITRDGQTTPELNATVAYNASVDLDAKTNLVRELTINGTQNQQPLLRAELTAPMALSLGGGSNAIGESRFNVTVTNLNLAKWKPFMGDAVSSGTVELQGSLVAQQGGNRLTFDITSRLANLTAQSGSNKIENADVTLAARGNATDLNRFDVSEYQVELAQGGKNLATISGSGTYDKTNAAADFKVLAEASLPALAKAMPQSDLKATAGSLKLDGQVTQRKDSQMVVGKLALADFAGQFKDYKFQNYGITADVNVAKSRDQIQIRKATGSLTEAQNVGGRFDVTGNYDRGKSSGRFAAKLSDINQNGLRPFLESLMKDKLLVSVKLDGDLAATFAGANDASVKGTVQITNLVVNDPKNPALQNPLDAKFIVDTSVKNQIAELRQFQIAFTPTKRAKNEITLSGRVDISTNAAPSALTLTAESLDVTRYYDLFATESGGKTGAVLTPAPSPTHSSALPQTEPSSIDLPARNLNLDMSIGRFFLREVEITNLQAKATILSNRIVLKPAQLALNGAPVSAEADVDCGVTGWRYNIKLNLQHVPLSPLVNSFQRERKGQIGGTLDLQAKASGAGFTDSSLKQNLSAQFDFGSTNLHLAIPSLRSKQLKFLITVIVAIPDLLKNRDVSQFVTRGITSQGSGGVMDELTQSPINVIQGRGAVRNGRVNLERTFVESAAFQAVARGEIRLEAPMTNSPLNIPLSVWLRRSIAEKIDFVPAHTPTNVAYVQLPDYVTEVGTIGEPKPRYNTKALLGTVVQQAGKYIRTGDERTDSLIQGIGGILTGQKPQQNPPQSASTNSPTQPQPTTKPKTNQPSLLEEGLKFFNNPKKEK